MTSEYDTPQSLLSLIRGEVEKDKPDKVAIEAGIYTLSRYIDAIHSFSHALARGELKGKFRGGSFGRTSIPDSDHFLSQFREFNVVLSDMNKLIDMWMRDKK